MVGTLLAGVIIGQLDIKVPAAVKNVFFDLFLFTTGYKVGPQFFRGLKKDALPQLAVTVVLCVTCLIALFWRRNLLGYDMGTAAGMLAGAFTESTVIGIPAMPSAALASRRRRRPSWSIIFRWPMRSLILSAPPSSSGFLNLGPKLMGVNLKEEAKSCRPSFRPRKRPEAGVRPPI